MCVLLLLDVVINAWIKMGINLRTGSEQTKLILLLNMLSKTAFQIAIKKFKNEETFADKKRIGLSKFTQNFRKRKIVFD